LRAQLVGADLEKADLRGGALATNGKYQAPQSVNFRGADLSGARLVGTMANHADFSDAILAQVNIQQADLRGARLVGADLSGADLMGVQLSGANLNNAILTGVNLDGIKDKGFDLSGAITDGNIGRSVTEMEVPLFKLIEQHQKWVESAGISGKQLDLSDYDMRELGSLKRERLTAIKARRAKFFGMNLFQVQMQSSHLEFSDFRRCDLEEADFRGSNLSHSKLSHAHLQRANFAPLMFSSASGNRFSPSDMTGAELRYADLRSAT
jgi:uncharacterized protein YjbI with pentapeptide repeats